VSVTTQMGEPERLHQTSGRVRRRRHPDDDLDAHEPAAAGIIQQAGHLEAAEGELLGDFYLRTPV
jgi:hypothetical protein